MQCSLKNGTFDLCCEAILQPQQISQSYSNLESSQVLRSGLEDPVDFPAIRQAIVPGDQVAIAAMCDTPRLGAIVETLVEYLNGLGIDSDSIILVTDGIPGDSELPWQIHQPGDKDQLAFLTALDDQAIYVNRSLFDADVVIPVTDTKSDEEDDTITPAFCGNETRELLSKLPLQERMRVTEQINDCIGAFWGVRSVCGTDGHIENILVGERHSISKLARQAYADIWQIRVPEKNDLVVATLENFTDQNWSNAIRAILQADQAVNDEGCIVLCTDLDHMPEKALVDPADETGEDPLSTIFRRNHIYLISELSAERTEDMGFGCIEDTDQLNRLASQFSSCTLLRDAHKIQFA